MFLVKIFLYLKFLIKIFYDVCINLHNCDVSLLIVSGGLDDDNGFVEIVECYDEESNEWKEVARMNDEYGETDEDISQVIVSYQPCVPDISENFPF